MAATIAAIQAGQLSKEMVKAINTTTLGVTRQVLAKVEKTEVDVLFVYGSANGVKVGQDERKAGNKGEWSALTGQFWAVKLEDPSKVFESGRLFLPAGQDMLEALIVTGELDAKDRPVYGKVDFAVMLVSEPAANAHGYRWKLRSLIDAGAPPPDAVQSRLLANMAAQAAKVLPAPTKSA